MKWKTNCGTPHHVLFVMKFYMMLLIKDTHQMMHSSVDLCIRAWSCFRVNIALLQFDPRQALLCSRGFPGHYLGKRRGSLDGRLKNWKAVTAPGQHRNVEWGSNPKSQCSNGPLSRQHLDPLFSWVFNSVCDTTGLWPASLGFSWNVDTDLRFSVLSCEGRFCTVYWSIA